MITWIGKQVRFSSKNKFLKGKKFTMVDIGWPSRIVAFWIGGFGGTVTLKQNHAPAKEGE